MYVKWYNSAYVCGNWRVIVILFTYIVHVHGFTCYRFYPYLLEDFKHSYFQVNTCSRFANCNHVC